MEEHKRALCVDLVLLRAIWSSAKAFCPQKKNTKMGISKPNSLLLLLLLFVVLASEKSSAVEARPLSSSQQSKDSKTQISITYIHAEEWVYTDEFVLIKLRVDFYGFFFCFLFLFFRICKCFCNTRTCLQVLWWGWMQEHLE